MRYFVVILSLIFFSRLSFAQDTAAPILEIVAPKQEVKSSLALLPTCDDSRLSQLLQDKMQEFQSQTTADSVYDKRQQILIKKNLSDFKETAILGFKPETNFDVANKIIMTKINQGLSEKQMRLCASNHKQLSKVVYLFIYPGEEGITVDVINLFNPSNASHNFSLIY